MPDGWLPSTANTILPGSAESDAHTLFDFLNDPADHIGGVFSVYEAARYGMFPVYRHEGDGRLYMLPAFRCEKELPDLSAAVKGFQGIHLVYIFQFHIRAVRLKICPYPVYTFAQAFFCDHQRKTAQVIHRKTAF